MFLYAPVTGQHAFNRVDVQGPFYYKQGKHNDDFNRILHPNVVLDWILTEAPELDNEASQQFRDDQTNSAANMTFALSYQYFKMCDDRAPLYDIIKIIKTVIFDQNKLSLKATITSRCQTS